MRCSQNRWRDKNVNMNTNFEEWKEPQKRHLHLSTLQYY